MAVGCGSHTAIVVDRGGAVVAHADVLTQVEWTRALDDISTGTVVVVPDGDCCEAFADVRAWRHKLVIYRDGDFVWEGPVVSPVWTADGITIQAVDVLGWLAKRVPHHDREFTDTDLALIGEWLIQDAFEPDDPGHSVDIVGMTGIRGAREYQIDVGQSADHLDDLAKTGLDYTAIGSKILLLPEGFCQRIGSLTDADFPEGLEVAEDGSQLATRVVVWGKETEAGSGESDIKGTAGGRDPYYGLLETVSEETSILDTASALGAARSLLRSSSAPLYIDTSQETTLAPNAAVDVPALVPGWCVDVTTTTTCRTVSQSLKIHGVKVTETATGERVSVQLVPSGG